VLVCSERKVLLTDCWWLVCSERSNVGWWLINQANRAYIPTVALPVPPGPVLVGTTLSGPKCKHLLAFVKRVWPSVLLKNYKNIIYFVMTHFIIIYILSISQLFLHFHKFFNKTNDQRCCKEMNLGTEEVLIFPSRFAEGRAAPWWAIGVSRSFCLFRLHFFLNFGRTLEPTTLFCVCCRWACKAHLMWAVVFHHSIWVNRLSPYFSLNFAPHRPLKQV
jgi:hypothetical protein